MTYVLIYKKVEQERIINLVLESHPRVIKSNKRGLTITNIKVSMALYNLRLQLRKPLSQDTVVKREKGQGKFILRYQDVQLPLVYCTLLDIYLWSMLYLFFLLRHCRGSEWKARRKK